MSAPQFTRAQLQEEALFQRRKTIFEKIHKIRTRFYNMDKEMVHLNSEV